MRSTGGPFHRGYEHKRCLNIIFCVLVLLGPLQAWAEERGATGQPDGEGGAKRQVYLPTLRGGHGSADSCEPVSNGDYGTRPVSVPETVRPAEAHADKNLALRGYERTSGTLGLVDYSGGSDPRAPQLRYLFGEQRGARFSAVYRVYEWDWSHNRRGVLISSPPVTLAGLITRAGEPIYTPRSGYDIGEGYTALVLYASNERVTIKYTGEDNVVQGYTIHVEGICVDPALLALYQRCDAKGRHTLPALRSGEAIGRARTAEVQVAVRDVGTFMDPRSRKDWWQSP